MRGVDHSATTRLHFSGGCLAGEVPRSRFESLASLSLYLPSDNKGCHEVHRRCECKVEVLLAPLAAAPIDKDTGAG